MTTVNIVNNIKSQQITPEMQQKRKEQTEKTATIVGSTGFAATATKYASKRGLAGSESTLQQMMNATTKAAKLTGKGAKEATGFIAKFKSNVRMYTNDILKYADSLKNNKYIGPIAKSPLIKKCASGFGVVMAFFVLVTGVSKAAENSALAIDDMKDKYHSMHLA